MYGTKKLFLLDKICKENVGFIVLKKWACAIY